MPNTFGESHVLLCERCGYVIDGIPADSPCPECGMAIRQSLPESRPGSPWQRRPRFASAVRTNWEILTRPRAFFRTVRPLADHRVWALLWINLGLGAVLPLIMWAVMAARYGGSTVFWYPRSTGQNIGVAATVESFTIPPSLQLSAVVFPALLVALFMLTRIEVAGVRFFGRRRQWRVNRGVAWSVCAHAAVGWSIGGLLHAISPWIVQLCTPILDRLPAGTAVRIAAELARWVPIGAFVVGMLVFETLVYVGVRECRYANAPRPTDSREHA